MTRKMYEKGMILCFCLILILGLLVACGSSNTATTMRLERTQGTVGVEDEKHTLMQTRDGMQLYSGYEVGTAQVSQAWIGLDDAKAVKLDEISTAEITKSGDKLSVKLEEGKLFFDVSQPVPEGETFTIETATIVTGIRGTSGWVEVLDDNTSRVTVLEGTVAVEYTDPESGERRQVSLTGGQILTAVYFGDGSGSGYGPGNGSGGYGGSGGTGGYGEDAAIQGLIDSNVIISGNIIQQASGMRVESLQEENVPEFVQEEIAQSQPLQQRIEEKSSLSVSEILDSVDTSGAPAQGAPANSAADLPEITPAPEQTQAQPQPSQQPPANPAIAETEIYYVEVTETTMVPVYGTEPDDANSSTTESSGATSPAETTGPFLPDIEPTRQPSVFRP